MRKILLATHNKGKLAECQKFFSETGITVIGAAELNIPDVEEDIISFADNARLKAEHGLKHSGLPSLADDSGVEVPALDNFPGVITARFATECGGYQQAIDTLCKRVGHDHFAWRYVAELWLALPNGQHLHTRATLEGTCTQQPRGENGFGHDPWFIPLGETRSCAEMTVAEKQAISHRGKALKQILELIKEHESLRAVS